MILYEQGKAYWEIARRYHTNRAISQQIRPTAVRDMQRLQQQTQCQAVLRRINSFIVTHSPRPPHSVA